MMTPWPVSRLPVRAVLLAAPALAAGFASAAPAPPPSFPERGHTPKALTPAEAAWLQENPLLPPAGITPPPSLGIVCPGEYEPMEGIIFAWEGPTAWLNIVAEMAARVTTAGNALAYIVVDAVNENSAATSAVQSRGGDTSRLRFVSRTIDTIWIRDYGPRYIYEGPAGNQVRAIVDHTYNRPRPNDDTFNNGWSPFRRHTYYELPLIHGGGNFHLSSGGIGVAGLGYATRLIVNENPGRTEAFVRQAWLDYQGLDVTLTDPFPVAVDSTQHIDMWMQVYADRGVMISSWEQNRGSTQDRVCETAATNLASAGYAVTRVPARSIGGTHYTYTNVVMCNDLVMIPSYTNSTMVPLNAVARSAWQAALPGKTIVQIPAQDIVTSAGVLHCIVMHVPRHRGRAESAGLAPTVLLKELRGGEVLQPGAQVAIRWISDDDESVSSIDVRLSRDGGATFTQLLANRVPDTGTFTWTVPQATGGGVRVMVTARDGAGRQTSDASQRNMFIGTPCAADFNLDELDDLFDYLDFGAAFNAGDRAADLDANGQVDFFDYLEFADRFGAGC
ncbi:MAG: agmatine deiminase family protein [Planctomycetota bacterium]|nr:agmatine deiminase family protein [Planctomycetota bacterium]